MKHNSTLTIKSLVTQIEEVNTYFINQVQKQVNVALTLRNWVIGAYIGEYEQKGSDRATYGKKVLSTITQNLKKKHIKGLSETNLKLYRTLYFTYPEIVLALSDKFQVFHYQCGTICQTVSNELQNSRLSIIVKSQTLSDQCRETSLGKIEVAELINRLSFSHIIELLKLNDNETKRVFYQTQAISNNWSVRQLQREINTMLYERTGLSTNKEAVLNKPGKDESMKSENFFRDPYILEFLGLPEKSEYSETDLEQAIINHLQNFLIEALQKRITFDNTHYKIDLVFYHRILKCHILIDLKLGKFTHADSGQMTVYLNYFKENEMAQGDIEPVGIILCASKNHNLVKYVTTGLPQKVFVSKYLTSLPSEDELKNIIVEEQ